ncbi:MAG: BON domain-containing protein [Vicinamibacteria bacterium]|nr:BON domain-containing protein [Vicinamibacteria bacterium]
MQKLTRALAVAGLLLGLTLSASVAQAADRPDSWVTLKTKLALLTADGIDTWDLNVDTTNGAVTLHGKVASEDAKKKAETVAAGIEGTKSVKNLLQVVPKPNREALEDADDVVKSNVEKALAADVALKGVEVASVNKGVVLLRGTVDTLEAHVKAVDTVSRVHGVRRVSTNVKTTKETD